MPILDKDGTVLKLRGPNPAMTVQSNWDYNHITLLNFVPEESLILRDRRRTAARKVQEQVFKTVAQEFVEELVSPTEIEELSEVIPVEDESENELAALMQQHSTTFLCMPVTATTRHDNLYGERYISHEYGKQIEIQAIKLDESDLLLSFWAEMQLNPKSVVYPQDKNRRCWKIESNEEKSGGFMHYCIPSDVTPSFKLR